MANMTITSSPDVMGGALVFTGTRVPVAALFDYLMAGRSIDDFLAGFASVEREQVLEVLRLLAAPLEKRAA